MKMKMKMNEDEDEDEEDDDDKEENKKIDDIVDISDRDFNIILAKKQPNYTEGKQVLKYVLENKTIDNNQRFVISNILQTKGNSNSELEKITEKKWKD